MGLQFSDKLIELNGHFEACIDCILQCCAVLNEAVQVFLLIAEAEEYFLGRVDRAVFNGTHHIEGILRGEYQHRCDIVHELVINTAGFSFHARAVHTELQRRGSLCAFAGIDLGIALEAAENFNQTQAATFKVAKGGSWLALWLGAFIGALFGNPVDTAIDAIAPSAAIAGRTAAKGSGAMRLSPVTSNSMTLGFILGLVFGLKTTDERTPIKSWDRDA